jgi:nucleotide-binding universal stress UspA family protein
MKLLVLTSEPISAQQLRDAVSGDVNPTDAQVMIVAPALQESPLKFWLADVDDAIARAAEVRDESVEQLDAEGVSVSGDTGESDPTQAIQDAAETFQPDRIVVFTHPESSQRYREGVDEHELQERFGIPVDTATLSA